MVKESLMGLVRHLATTAGGYFMAQGYVQEGQVEMLAGAAAVIVGIIWSIWQKRKGTPA